MKRAICAVVMGLLLVVLAADLFAAAGHRMTRFVPRPSGTGIMAESAYVSMDTLMSPWSGARFIDLDKYRVEGATRMIVYLYVKGSDTDMDSCEILTRFTDDGLNHVVVDSQEVTGSTTGSAMYKDYPLDSLYSQRYMQIIGRTHGDAAGTAIQTISFAVSIVFVDYNRTFIKRYGPDIITSSFQE